MTQTELSEIRAALTAVECFELPWRAVADDDVEDWEILTQPHPNPAVRTIVAETSQNEDVANFIANAPRWIAALLDAVEATP